MDFLFLSHSSKTRFFGVLKHKFFCKGGQENTGKVYEAAVHQEIHKIYTPLLWKKVGRIMPDYEEHKAWLKANSGRFFLRDMGSRFACNKKPVNAAKKLNAFLSELALPSLPIDYEKDVEPH